MCVYIYDAECVCFVFLPEFWVTSLNIALFNPLLTGPKEKGSLYLFGPASYYPITILSPFLSAAQRYNLTMCLCFSERY